MTNHLITALEITDYKRIHTVKIEPAADTVLVLIGGDNAQGKTSVLDALEALLGGSKEILTDPVRHGAASAQIAATLTPDGAPPLTVRRKVSPDGTSALEVRDDLGAVKSPQAVLDKLIGGRFIDPLRFLALKPGDQRAALLRLIDADGTIAKLETRRQRVFDRRTEVARDMKRTEAAALALPAAESIPDPVDVAALVDEREVIGARMDVIDKLFCAHDEAISDAARARLSVALIEEQIAKLRGDLAREIVERDAKIAAVTDREAAVAAVRPEIATASARRDVIKAELALSTTHNQKVAAARALEARRNEVIAERDRLREGHGLLETELEVIDAAKQERLFAAQLPVPGLDVTADGVTYHGAPLASASGAERMTVAIAIAAAAQPQLRDVWIRDGAILDDKMLARVAELARAAGIRVWIERVGTRDPGVIEIRDGRVADPIQGRLL